LNSGKKRKMIYRLLRSEGKGHPKGGKLFASYTKTEERKTEKLERARLKKWGGGSTVP